MSVDAAIIGLGYVGLPLALEAARAGLSVIGFDINQGIVDSLNAGRSHIDDLSDEDVASMTQLGFVSTSEEARLAEAKVVVICVPTPLAEDGGPDLRAVQSAVEAVARNLRPEMVVILESTTYPGTTEEVVLPKLEESGLIAGKDFCLAYSPERIDPGNPNYGPENTPKVVGGHTARCAESAADFYGQFVKTVVRTKGTREAEMAKLLENTYRHINIALVNEMTRFCHELDIDLWDVINAAASKPFGFQAFYPGPGVGGHCIPIDPNYLSHQVRARLGYPFRFVELAQEINSGMPTYVVHRVQDILNDEHKSLRGATVLLLGVTYKANIADQRESPAVPLAKQLIAKGAVVHYHDPHLSHWGAIGDGAIRVEEPADAVSTADLTILVQNHREYDVDSLAAASRAFFDTRGVANGMKVRRL
ncbi:MAG: nucleotide sugar dehydrogenase [Ornithinimicrobium sp.]